MSKLPEVVFVLKERDLLEAQEKPENLYIHNEKITIGKYKLVEKVIVENKTTTLEKKK